MNQRFLAAISQSRWVIDKTCFGLVIFVVRPRVDGGFYYYLVIAYFKQVNRDTVTFVLSRTVMFAGEQRLAIPGPVVERFLLEGLSTPGGRSTGEL